MSNMVNSFASEAVNDACNVYKVMAHLWEVIVVTYKKRVEICMSRLSELTCSGFDREI